MTEPGRNRSEYQDWELEHPKSDPTSRAPLSPRWISARRQPGSSIPKKSELARIFGSIRCGFSLSLPLRPCFPIIVMHQPRDSDPDDIKAHHWGCQNAHFHDVAGRSNNGGNYKNGQHRIAQVAPHPPRAHNSHQCQKENQNWHFKNRAQTKDDRQKEIRIFVDGNHRLKLLAESDQEIQCQWIHQLVPEVAATNEQRDSRKHKRHYIPFFMTIEAWRNEHPELI